MPTDIRTRDNSDHRKRGFERVSSLLRREFRIAGEKRGFAVVRLLTHWAEIVGDDIARIARPEKVSYPKARLGATLTLLTPGPQAPILAMKLESIRERVNAVYGYSAIGDILISQTTPADFERCAPADGPHRKPDPEPDTHALNRAREAVADVSDDGLRRALELFGESVLTNLSRK
ncbi:MAG: DUF721 domain-containing protein [Rhodobacter sp.]|nr:DUF721 domain-containing protein [Rhodobacter sp.]MCY4167542.1 DUF721 domain-containing protein [Rhodobacter sp.]MCY4241633.1 DUF721 domain-containing protein [Rhodobacter sp.]